VDAAGEEQREPNLPLRAMSPNSKRRLATAEQRFSHGKIGNRDRPPNANWNWRVSRKHRKKSAFNISEIELSKSPPAVLQATGETLRMAGNGKKSKTINSISIPGRSQSQPSIDV